MSSIEWTDDTWNPIVGCTRISHGCDHCYAIMMATRLSGTQNVPHYRGTVKKGDWTGVINEAPPHIFEKPLRTKKATVYFVNSMSDLFHEAVADETIKRVFEIMNSCPRHVFQVLTKRPSRMVKKTSELDLLWSDNIWAGTSIESDKYAAPRARELMKVPALVRFVSAEPLIGPLPSLPIEDLDWVIAGGESGNRKTVRACSPDWLRDLRDRCHASGVPFFFKQWGSFDQNGNRVGKREGGHLLDGEEIFEMPAVAYDQLSNPDPRWTPIKNSKPAERAAHHLAAQFYVNQRPKIDLEDAVIACLSEGAEIELSRPDKLVASGEAERLKKKLEKLQSASALFAKVELPTPDWAEPIAPSYLDLVGEGQ